MSQSIELSIAQSNIATQLKSGSTNNILSHLGQTWHGDNNSIKLVNQTALMIRSKIIDAVIAMIEARDQLMAEDDASGITPEEADALFKGLMDGFKSAINDEMERAIIRVYSRN